MNDRTIIRRCLPMRSRSLFLEPAMIHRSSLCILAVTLLMLTGCGKPGVKLGEVTGTVKMEGRPLANALVRFAHEAGGRSSQGMTNTDGQYALSYTARLNGTLVGRNKVMITTGPLEDTSRKSETVAKQFNDETTLIADVKAGSNTFNFDVEPKPKK